MPIKVLEYHVDTLWIWSELLCSRLNCHSQILKCESASRHF